MAAKGPGGQSSLFSAAGLEDAAPRPLADRLRPRSLDDVIGQDHLLGADGALRRLLRAGHLPSLVLWGPPGTGKTTIARLLAREAGLDYAALSAVFSGVADLRRQFDEARARRADGRGTLLFVDEIHRFNRAQQDGFLPYVEDGTVILVGATTENPSFEINAALLSRAQVLVLHRLGDGALELLLQRAEAELAATLPLEPEARTALRALADGDGRYLLNMAEQVAVLAQGQCLDVAALSALLQRRAPLYDKSQDGHYNLISALHKAMRASDADAALYWLARMLAGGEEPLYIARRLVRFASEDVGLADPQALVQALAAKSAYDFLGTPERELAIAQAVLYLSVAPKSNSAYKAFGAARRAARDTGSLMPRLHSLNAPTRLMKELGYSDGYAYDHDEAEGFSGQDHFPEGLDRQTFYHPSDRGLEVRIAERLAHWERLRRERQ